MLKNKRGIVLITTMLTVVLVIMLLSSVVYSNLGSMRLASNFYGREEALMAAQSGVQYAITRLQDNITWRGDNSDNDFSDTSKGLSVREKNGNVVGMLTTANGNKSFFRIKFNYEDGEKGFDGLSNSSDSDRIRSPYVSVNNLFNTTPTKVYTASKDGELKLKQYQDKYGKNRFEAEGARSFSLSKSSCYLVVEGFAGNGARDLTLNKAFSLTPEEAAGLIPSRVEAYLALSSDAQFTDSVACAAGDLNSKSDIIRISNAKGSSSPKMRSLHNLNVNSGTVDFADGQLFYGSGYNCTINGKKLSEDSQYTTHQSNDSSAFTRLEWDNVIKADTKGQKYEKVEAGTYVWSKDPKTKKNVLKRYVGNYPPGTDIPANTECSIVSSLPGVDIDNDNLTMKINTNLLVASNGKASSFIVRYEKTGDNATSRPIVAFLKNEATQSSPILSSDNNICIEGATLGGGSITSKKDISLQGPSILESDPGIGVSIYAQGDVNLLPIEGVTEQVKKAESDKLSGTDTVGGTNNGQTAILENQNDYKVKRDRAFAAYQALIGKYSEYYKEHGLFKDQEAANNIFNDYFDTLQNNITYSLTGQSDKVIDIKSYWPSDDCDLNALEISKCLEVLQNNLQELSEQDQYFNDTYYVSDREQQGLGKDILEARKSAYKTGREAFQYIDDKNNWNVEDSKKDSDTKEADVDLSPDKVSDVQDYIDKDIASDNFRDTKEAQLTDLMLRYGSIKYSDQDISGVIYAWGDINANIGKNSTLNLTGAMVAYGGNPKDKTPGKNTKGKITINAGTIGMTLDPDYMGAFLSATSKRKVKQVMFSSFQFELIPL